MPHYGKKATDILNRKFKKPGTEEMKALTFSRSFGVMFYCFPINFLSVLIDDFKNFCNFRVQDCIYLYKRKFEAFSHNFKLLAKFYRIFHLTFYKKLKLFRKVFQYFFNACSSRWGASWDLLAPIFRARSSILIKLDP